MRLVAVSLTVLAACGFSWNASEFPNVPVRPEAPPGLELLWQAEVQDAITLWFVAVERYGCASPFRLAERFEEARPVKMVADARWEHPGYDGMCWYNHIEVRQGSHRGPVLAHELGHAMGLDHHTPNGGASIMDNVPSVRQIEDRDAMAAACMLGCGPCDTIDEYDSGW